MKGTCAMGTEVAYGTHSSHTRHLARDFFPAPARGLASAHRLSPHRCHHRPFVSLRRAGDDGFEALCSCRALLMTYLCIPKTLHAQNVSLNLKMQGSAAAFLFVELHQRHVPASARSSVRRSFSFASSRCASFLNTAMNKERQLQQQIEDL